MYKYIVTFDKSNEGIPTLVVARDSYFALSPGMDIVSIHTGSEAERIWSELSDKVQMVESKVKQC